MKEKNSPRALALTWLAFGTASLVLIVLSFLYLNGKHFSPEHLGAVDSLGRPRKPSYPLILLLGAAINTLLYLIYRIDPEGKLMPRLNVPAKDYWLVTPERRALYSLRMKKVAAAMGSYINFLISTTLYMTLHYFYPRLPCPRHLLMLLVWLILTVVVGIYCVAQFRRPRGELA